MLELELPDGWNLWLLCLTKFAVTGLAPLPEIRAITNCLADKQIITPRELAVITKTGINYIRSQDPSLEGVEIIWQSAKSRIDYIDQPRTTPPIAFADQVLVLISSIKAETIELSRIPTGNNNRQKRQIGRPWNYDKLTPEWKTRSIAELGPSAQGLTQFLDSHARIYVIRGVRSPIRSVASGITRCVKFFPEVQTSPFPVAPITIRRRGATFNYGKTFGLYLNHVKKESLLMGKSTTWHVPAIRAVAKGLENAQER